MRIGWAAADITPDRPVYLAGQLYVRVSRYVHDPITASALALDNGDQQAVFVSMDTVAVPDFLTAEIRCRLAERKGPDPDRVSLCATHTHTSSRFSVVGNETLVRYMGSDKIDTPEAPENILCGEEGRQYLADRIESLIMDAWENRREGSAGTAEDYAVVGFNRRPVFGTGDHESAKMYGDCSQASFLRFEGTTDPTVTVLYTWDEAGTLTGAAVNIPCPAQVMELHSFLSADYWHYARKHIRDRLGNIHILPLCGAAGDQNPLDLVRISKDNNEELLRWGAQEEEVFRNFDMTGTCEAIGERIAEAVARGYRAALGRKWSRPVFAHRIVQKELPLRTVSEEEYREAEKIIRKFRGRFTQEHRMGMADQRKLYGPVGIAERYALQQKGTSFPVELHILRLQDAVFVTHPFELFTEYGLRIRAGCRARCVFHIQLCNGYADYLPTRAAIWGGSYSSEPASTYVGPNGGDLLAAGLTEEANRLFGMHGTEKGGGSSDDFF